MRFGWLALSLLVACGFGIPHLAAASSQSQSATQNNQAQQNQSQDQKAAYPPVPLNAIEAEFPSKARQKLLAGVCVVSITVDTRGNPQNLSIIRCSDPVFAQNSLDAASKYRFEPARNSKRNPVPVKITVEINFKLDTVGGLPDGQEPKPLLKYGFSTPPGVTSFDPDAHGVYPLSKLIKSPTFTKFVDEEFSNTAMNRPTNVACDVVITLDAKGRPSDAQVNHCDDKALEKPAKDSLLHSRFNPGTLNGEPVSIRLLVHLYYGGFVSQP